MSKPTPTSSTGPKPLQLSAADRIEIAKEFRLLIQQELAENNEPSNIKDMKPYSEWKHDLLQIVATALAIAAITVPLLQWGIDSKVQGMESKLDAVNTKMDARFEQLSSQINSINENLKDHQAMYERVIDERTGKK